ncbi:Voltage-gated ion channel [Globisporangium polare]
MIAGLTGKREKAEGGAVDAAEPRAPHELVLDRFCLRQFDDPKYLGTQIRFDKAEFERKVNEIYLARNKELVDGYAPFCKHLFIENFTDTRVNVVKITQSNSRLLQSDYEARAENELPVLVRWFPSHSVTPMVAKYLDIILYSREQIRKENDATGQPNNDDQLDAPWGIISVKAQDVDHELPMNPITVMRNALGKEEGGSGVPLDRNAYLESVEYWKNHALVK